MVRFTPPTTAISVSPRRMESIELFNAVIVEEHAVSTAKLSPWKSMIYEARFAIAENAAPPAPTSYMPELSFE